MIRPATVAAVALGFLTAFVVGMLGLLVTDLDVGSSPESVPDGQTESLVESFYEGINAWIATEDRALEVVIAPDFIDHTLSRAPDRDKAAFYDYLNSVRTALPSLRFDILEIDASGPTVSVDLMGVPGEFHATEGWRIALPAQQPFREILQIEGDRIVERWSPDDLWPDGAALIEREVPVGAEAYRQPAIQQFFLEPESAFDLAVSGTVLLWIRSGELAVDSSGWEQAGNPRIPTEAVSPGKMRLVDSQGILRVRTLGSERTELWTVSLDLILIPSRSVGKPTSDVPSGIHQDAGLSLSVQLPSDRVRLSVGIYTLPEGSALSMNAAYLQAVAIMDGELQIERESGDVFFCFDRSRSRLVSIPEIANVGQGFAIQRGGSASFQVVGPEPTTLLLLAIHSADSLPDRPIRAGQA